MHPCAGLDPIGRPFPFCGGGGRGRGGRRLLPTVAGLRVTEPGLEWEPPVSSTQVPSSLLFASCGPRGWASLYMLFSAASEWCCVILWLRVVCGMLSVWASAGSGRVKPRPKPVAWDGSGQQHPSPSGEPEREAPSEDAKAPG